MTKVDTTPASGLAEVAPDLGALLAERIRKEDQPGAPRFDTSGPIRDAARAITEAVLASRDGVGADFETRTRAPLATLVAAWRRWDFPERDFTAALNALADRAVHQVTRQTQRSRHDQARSAAAVLDATQLLVRRSQRTFRSWRHRIEADEAFSIAVFGEALSHEIRNRIHAAHTALEVLRREEGLDAADRVRLQLLLKEAVVAARRAVFDVRLVTAEDPRKDTEVSAVLHELVRHTVARHRIVSDRAGVALEDVGTVPTAHVDARRAQVILNNMLDVGTHLVRAAGGSVLRLEVTRPEDGDHVEVTVSADRPFLTPFHGEVLMEAWLADPGDTIDPARLGLWLAREAATSIGGDLQIMRSRSGGPDALTARIPAGRPRYPAS